MESVTFGFIVSGLLVGSIFGFVLQRGRFCINTGFRDIIFMNDFTLFRAYILALVTMIIGANLFEYLGIVTALPRHTFYPLANILGGYIFGLGMVLAGGCGSGITYRIGEGQLGAWVAFMGFALGITATLSGVLNPIWLLLKSVRVGPPQMGLWQIFGEGLEIKWIIIAILSILALAFILKGKPFARSKRRGFYWSITGLLVGLIGVFAFWASQYWGGGEMARGLNFTTPAAEFTLTLVTGEAKSVYFPMYDLGPFKVTWAIFFLIGVPIGSYISARQFKEFSWKVPPAKELLTVLFGGFMMGFGGGLAGGCNVGQGLTGACTLSIGSLVAVVFMILGNWTLVYFKFIKPMKEM